MDLKITQAGSPQTAAQPPDTVEAELRALFAAMDDPIFVLDAEGRYLDIAPTNPQGLMRPREELIGHTLHDIFPAARADEFVSYIRQALETGRVVAAEYSLNIGGEEKWFSASISPMPNNRAVWVARDITARKLAEAAEREQRELAEALRDSGAVLSASLDVNTVLDKLLDLIARVVPYDSGNVMLVEEGRVRLARLRGYERFGANVVEAVRQINFEIAATDNLRRMVETGKPFSVGDTVAYPGWIPGVQGEYIRSWLGAPIVAPGGDTLAFFSLDKTEPNYYQPRHAEWLAAFAGQAGLALQNARLFEESQRQTRELASLYTTAAALTRDTMVNTDKVLWRLHEQVQLLMPSDSFGVILYDAETEELELALAIEDGKALPRIRVPLAEGGLTGWVVRTQQPLLVRDLEHDSLPAPVRNITERQSRSWLGVPLIARDRIIGAVSVQSFRRNAYSEDNRRLLESLSSQIAIVIENARLFEATRRQLEELTVLHAVAVAGAEAATEDELIERATQVIGDTLYPDNFGVLLVDEARQALRAHPSYQIRAADRSGGVLPLGTGVSGQVVRTGKPVYAPDVSRAPEYFAADALTRSELCVPLVIGGQVVGVVNAESAQAAAFNAADRQLLVTLSRQLSTAMAKLRLLAAERSAREQAEALREVAMTLNASLDRGQLLDIILETLARVVNYDSASLMLISGDALQFVAHRGFQTETQFFDTLPLASLQHVQDVLTKSRAVIIADTAADPGWRPVAEADYIRCWLGVPLVVKGRVIGLLNLDKNEPRYYTHDDARLASAFASQAALAIENARLFDETRRSADEMKVVSDVLRALNAAPDVTEAFADIAAGIKQLTGCERVSVALFDERNENFTVTALDQPRRELGVGTRMPVSATAAAGDVSAGRPHLTPDLAAETGFAAERALYMAGFRSRLNVPLRVNENVVGALNLVWMHELGYTGTNMPLLGQVADAIALALEKSRLFDETRRRDAILESLTFASEQLLMPGDLGEVLPGVLAQLGRAVAVSRAYIFQNHTSAEGALLHSSRYEWVASDDLRVTGGDDWVNIPYEAAGFARWQEMLAAGRPFHGLVREFPAAERAVLARRRVRSLAVVPIFCGGDWWGFLGFDDCAQDRQWLGAEIEALKGAAGAFGAAFARQRSEIAEREHRTLNEALRITATVLSSTLNFAEVVDRILDNVGRVAPHDAASVLLVDSGAARLVGARGFKAPGRDSIFIDRFPFNTDLPFAEPLKAGRPVLVRDTRRARYWTEIQGADWIGSHVSAAMTAKGRLIGLINLESATPDFFTETHAERLQAFAGQASIAIENAQLYDELAALYRAASQLFNPGGGVGGMAEQVAQAVVREFNCIRCVVALLDDGAQTLRVLAQGGLTGDPLPADIPLAPLAEPGLMPQVVASGEMVYLPDLTEASGAAGEGTPARSRLVLPIRVGRQVTGVMSLDSSELDGFGERTRRIITAFAEHAGLALQNAQLLTRLDSARRVAEEASELKSVFLANTSHELRTPLTGIIGSLSMVVDNLCTTPQQEREFVEIAYTASGRLLSIINDLLDIAKIEAGRMEVYPQPVLLGELFADILPLARVQAQDKGLMLEMRPPADPQIAAWADPDKLRQILLNLIGNAIKFTERGRVTAGAHVDSRAGQVKIMIQDTGIGIPPDKQAKLFQPFVQADGSPTRQYGGTGLGLSISRRLAEMMDGSLGLFSAGAGQGTTFTLARPMASADADPAPPRGAS
ncbi:MAG: GAF domain-containing protein [Chloroflexi bacterium]|nr:GAF domain-containing protein [Chloroflexota bacterium]